MPLKIYFEDEVRFISDPNHFFREHTLITAAGGLVMNDEGGILMIFRRGKWDLPKGKLDEGETLEECADREIKEETGLSELLLNRFLLTTFHTYVEKDKPIVKETHWFLFRAPGKQMLKPQTEEDIAKAEWVNPEMLDSYTSNTYALIKDVLSAGAATD